LALIPERKIFYMSGNAVELMTDCQTLVNLLRQRAQEQPTQQLYIFLPDSEEETSLTYAELDGEARRIGAWLQNLGARGERVLLVYPSGLDFITAFFGCLYAGRLPFPRIRRGIIRI
jgi:acyl-CoA synthetase (AMP-forming)/AMP-acid ligase II